MDRLANSTAGTPARTDPVTLEIFKNALEALADEMALIILRSAYSPIVRDSMDYSTAICDPKGRVVAQGLTNPIHLGSFPRVMEVLIERHGDELAEGDGYLVNDPYEAGGMHLPDVYFIRPVFAAHGLAGFAAALVHHTDIGGMAAGSMALEAAEIFQEGLRLPLVRLYEKGRANQAVFEIFKANSRMTHEVIGDLRAQISACDTVGASLASLADRHGAEYPVLIEKLHDYAERLVRQRIEAIPDGTVIAEDYIDGLGADGGRIVFKVAITVRGSDILFDWEGTSDQVEGSINGPITTTWSMAYVALRAALGPGIPNCQGYMRPVDLRAPLGSIVNPRPFAACAARGVIAYRMLDTCLAAIGKLLPGAVPAGGEGGPTAITFSGLRPENNERWLVTDGILGSWGGRSRLDGPEGISNPGTNLSNQPVELIEGRLPLRIEQYGFVTNSGGAGRRRGGLAMIRSYVVDALDARLTLRSDRRANLPQAIEGGLPGSPSLSIHTRADGSRDLLPVMRTRPTRLGKGDRVVHVAAGGAGYGDPLERSDVDVLEDVLDGRIDCRFAAEVYGVEIDADGTIDAGATAVARNRLRAVPLSDRAEVQKRIFLQTIGAEGLEVGRD